MAKDCDNARVSGGKDRAVQVRTARKDGWTKAKRAIFFDTLAATCNVKRSAEAAGMREWGAYNLRRRDPAFGELWRQALEAGYERLEEGLLARAIGDDLAAIEPGESGSVSGETTAKGFDPELALRILGQRNNGASGRQPKRVGPRPRVASIDDLVKALDRRLAAIARRGKA